MNYEPVLLTQSAPFWVVLQTRNIKHLANFNAQRIVQQISVRLQQVANDVVACL